MENKQVFKKYYTRLALEGIIMSMIWAFIVAFLLSAISALITFLIYVDGLWISIGIAVIVSAAAAPLFYFKKFHPTGKRIAERVDRLGLEERLITMVEMQKDESYIAMIQREDAQEKLHSVSGKKIKLSFPAVPIITAIMFTILAVSLTTVSALSVRGALPEWMPPPIVEPEQIEYVEVNYFSYGGGYIIGEAMQLVPVGEDATTVVAVADEGYMFTGWFVITEVDGYNQFVFKSDSAERTDYAVRENIELHAWFEFLEEGIEGDSADENESDLEMPGKPSNQEETDGGGKSPDDGSAGGGGIGNTPNNNVIDGKTDYRTKYDEYYEFISQLTDNGGEVPQYLLKFIEAYFDIIG